MDPIVLITVDCLRADHVGEYGYKRDTTPNIDELAESAAMYTSTYSNGPGTRWAFRAINNGVYPLRVDGAGIPKGGGKTVAEALSEQGYRTGAFVDNPFLTPYFNHDRGFGTFRGTEYWSESTSSSTGDLESLNSVASQVSRQLSGGIVHRGLKSMYNRFLQTVEAKTERSLSTDEAVVDEAVRWIDEARQSEEPYFAWIHLIDAHHPHQYHPEHRRALGVSDDSEHVRLPTETVEANSPPPQNVIDTYDANLREADSHVGRVLANVADDSVVVLTGDHGEEFGRHNGFHTASTYETMTRVPLLIRSPDEDGQKIDQPVNHIDLPPTILKSADGTAIPEQWDGVPLDDTAPPDRDIFLGIEFPDYIAGGVVRDTWKYRCTMANYSRIESDELYDLSSDPEERIDRQDEEPDRYRELKSAWREHLENIKTDRLVTEHDVYDREKQGAAKEIVGTEDREVPREVDDRLENLGYK